MRKQRVFIITIYDLSDGQVELCLTPREGKTLPYLLGDVIATLYTNTNVKEVSLRWEEA